MADWRRQDIGDGEHAQGEAVHMTVLGSGKSHVVQLRHNGQMFYESRSYTTRSAAKKHAEEQDRNAAAAYAGRQRFYSEHPLEFYRDRRD